MGYVSISLEDQREEVLDLELDITVEDAKALIGALMIIIERRKL
jgi:hypothetical protein